MTDYRRTDALLLRFKSSKADQEGAGATRNNYRTNERLCPVEAVELLQRHLGHRVTRELHEPLLRWEDNSPLAREHIQAILERGAVAVDIRPISIIRISQNKIWGLDSGENIFQNCRKLCVLRFPPEGLDSKQ